MYSKTSELFHIFGFILLLKRCQSGQSFCGDTDFELKSEDIKRNVDELGQKTVADVHRCIYLCYHHLTCNSIQYNSNTGLCITHALSLEGLPGSDAVPEPGTQIFFRQSAGVIGSSCTTNNDCVLSLSVCNVGTCACDTDHAYIPNSHACLREYESACTTNSQCNIDIPQSECFQGECKCTPGYSFHQGEHTCIHPCGTYADTMTLYPGHAIKEYNDLVTTATSPEDCSGKCVAETTFVCTTFDYIGPYSACQLSTTSYLEAPASNQLSGQSGYVHGIRQCA